MPKKKTVVDTRPLAEQLREVASGAEARLDAKVREQADALVSSMYDACVARARAAADSGYHTATAHLARPYTNGNRVTQATMIDELVVKLEGDGFDVETKIDQIDNWHPQQLFVTMNWAK